MQPVLFARTKIQSPAFRRGLIERHHLEELLRRGLTAMRLVLLMAPAGYGKTAALSQALRRLPEACAVAWVTADRHDNFQRLILCLAEALEPFDPPWRVAPEALAMRGAQPEGLRFVAQELVDTLQAMPVTHGVIALDDLHCVSDPQVFELLNRVLRDLPSHWTVAIAARAEPPLALNRLRAHRELVEFRQQDLSFSDEEIRRLCAASGAAESTENVAELQQRTRGWATGLALSLDARGAHMAPGHRARLGERHLFEYLASEVLADMPPELREFLLRCAVLPELSAERCAAVSGNPRARQLLDEIERQGLFVSVLENEELTLRLHDLFRDFLDDQLRRRHPEELPALLRRAAEGESDPMRKANLLLRGGAWTQAEQMLAELAPLMLASGDTMQLIRLIEQFPPALRDGSPQLAYVRGLCAWHQYLDATVQENMSLAAQGFDAMGKPDEAQQARAFEALALLFLGQFEEGRRLSAVVRARPMDLAAEALCELFDYWDTGFHGPAAGPARHLGRLVDLLSGTAGADLWYRCVARIFLFVGRVGVNAHLHRFVRASLAAAGDGYEPLRAAAGVIHAWLLIWQGDFAQAGQELQRIGEDARWLGEPGSLQLTLLQVQGAYHGMRNDRPRVRAVLQALPSSARHETAPRDLLLRSLLIEAYVAMLDDDVRRLQQALRAIETAEGAARRSHLQPVLEAYGAICAFAEGHFEDAARILRRLLPLSVHIDRMGLEVGIRVLLARSELRLGDVAAAWGALQPALQRVDATGEPGDLIQAGDAALAELAATPWGALALPQEIELLERWARDAWQLRLGVTAESEPPPAQDMALSAREREVLGLLAVGQSNKLIARNLALSPHTVKRHVARILQRLELKSRVQAAAWYRRQQPM
jgi:LuxR family maltose regulon positive regulatory protein